MYQFLMKNKLAVLAFVIFILAIGQLFRGGGDRELYSNTQPPADLAQSNPEAGLDEIGVDPSTAAEDLAETGEFAPDDLPMGFTPDEDLIDSADGFDPTPEEDQSFADEPADESGDEFDVGAE